MRAGDATFHTGWTLHRAPGNATDAMREVMTIIYFADGVQVAQPQNTQQEADLQGCLPGLKPGDLAASEINPLAVPRGRSDHAGTAGSGDAAARAGAASGRADVGQARVRVAKMVKGTLSDPAVFTESLSGARILSVGRRGKHLIIALDSGYYLLFHLNMRGQLLVTPSEAPEQKYLAASFLP